MVAKLKSNLLLVLAAVTLLWAVEAVNLITEHTLSTWGILPRTLTGLRGIPLSPFLHANLSHLLVNTLPFLVLGGLVCLQGKRAFLGVSLFIVLTGGAAVWLFGRMAYHIGASGLIFGFFGYLVARGWYERSLGSILIALVTLFFYGSLVWGVLPTTSYISWEGHLFGLLAGIVAARIQGSSSKEQPA
ncbi:MAG: rhomboid family intramembrane serine protease [Chloroflexi bacterium]|nr:rhomboid family intramembrane serine protease [Chloroflexota bacterium]